MNLRKFLLILVVGLLAGAAIYAFGADGQPGNRAGEQLSASDISSETNNLRDNDMNVRLNAVTRLSRAKDKRAKSELIKELRRRGSSQHVKAVILESFSTDMDSTTAKEALDTLKNDTDKELRQSAAFSLGFTKDNSAVKPLIDTFLNENEDVGVRCMAAGSLARLKPTEQIYSCFVQGMQNANPYIRMQAITSLSICFGGAGNKRAIDEITKMLNDSDVNVRNAAKQRLTFLGVKTKK